MKILHLIALSAFALGACSKPPTVEKLTQGLELSRFELENGLRLAVVEDPSSPTVAVQVWYQVGSRDEKKGKTGLAHLFEHMMFKRTKNLPEGEFDRLLETAGAEGSNAYTVRDATVYVVEVPKESAGLALRLEAERMENLIIDEQSFKTEREVVHNERRQTYENNPDGILFHELYELVFAQSSYRWPIIGYKEDLDSMTAQDAQEFFADFYHPSRAVLIVVGDVSASKIHQEVKGLFGKIGLNKKVTARAPAPTEPAQTNLKRKIVRIDTPVRSILMGIRAPRLENEDRPAFEVMGQILAGGRSSRLQKALVDTGISSSVSTLPPPENGDSLLLLGTSLQSGRKPEDAERAIAQEFKALGLESPSTAELEAAKNQLLFARHMQWMTHEAIAQTVGQALTLFGSVDLYQKHVEKLFQVTAQDVQKVASKYLIDRNLTTVVGVPK
jgi:zinc protease